MPFSTLHRLTCAILTSAAVLIPASVHAQRAEGSFERTLTVAERPDVEIESGSGGIDVRQGGAGRIEVRGQIRAQDWGWRRGPTASRSASSASRPTRPLPRRATSSASATSTTTIFAMVYRSPMR